MTLADGFRLSENSPAAEEAQGQLMAPATPTSGKISDDHDQDEHGHHHGKKLMAKMKDAARKLKRTLSKKRSGNDAGDGDDVGHFYREEGGVNFVENGEGPNAKKNANPVLDSAAPAPELHAATAQAAVTYETEGPAKGTTKSLKHQDSFKEKDIQAQLDPPPAAVAAAEAKDIPMDPAVGSAGDKTLAEAVSQMLAPAYAAVGEAARAITSKIQAPSAADREAMSKQMWDKGLSMKEYIIQRLEPGEDEKALSEAITAAMSPRKKVDGAAEEGGMAERVKGAVHSILGNTTDQLPWLNSVSGPKPVLTVSKSSQSLPVSTSPRLVRLKAKPAASLPSSPRPPEASSSAFDQTAKSAFYDVTAGNCAQEGIIEEEQTHGKILQEYLN